jgi:Rad3-related DNA helicase
MMMRHFTEKMNPKETPNLNPLSFRAEVEDTMSELTSLAIEFQENADFSQRLNQAVLTLQKRRLGRAGPGCTDQDVEQARQLLIDVVAQLRQRLADDSAGVAEDSDSLPPQVVQRLREKQTETQYLTQDLEELETTLRTGKQMTNEQFELVDSLLQVAETAASASFRRLWRR